jgi:hypothetical protein
VPQLLCLQRSTLKARQAAQIRRFAVEVDSHGDIFSRPPA